MLILKYSDLQSQIPAWEIFVAVQKTSSTVKCVTSVVNCRTLTTNCISKVTLLITGYMQGAWGRQGGSIGSTEPPPSTQPIG